MKRALAIGIAAALGGAAEADLISHARVSYGNSPLITVEQFGTTSATASNSYSSPGVFSGTAEAWAAYGYVRARAHAASQNAAFETQLVQAESGFTDVLTISGHSGAGFIRYQYMVIGSTIGHGHAAHAHVFLRHEGDPDEELGEDLTGSALLTSLPHGFTFGVPFSTGIVLAAEVHMHHGQSGSMLADFSSGTTLTGFSIFDAQMNPVSQFEVNAASGTMYPLPSPGGAAVMLATGAVGIRRRRAL